VCGAKGSLHDVKTEAGKYTNNALAFDEDVVKRAHKDVRACLTGCREVCLSFEEVLANHLEMNTSSGQPWKEYTAKKQDLMEELGYDVLLDALYEYERQILSCEDFSVHTWDVLPKEDKYKWEKLENGRLRTIQASDFFYLCLLIRWTGPAVKAVYDRHPRFLVKFTPGEFLKRVTVKYQDSKTFGLDATGLDRGIPAQSIADTIHVLSAQTTTPENIEAFLSYTAIQGPLQFADGSYDDSRVGGNVSGIWLTTLINCMFMDCLLLQVSSDMYGSPEKALEELDWLICGDDVIAGTKSESPDIVMEEVFERAQGFNIDFKLDSMQGHVYPEGIACHAPFLGRVSVLADDYLLTVPLEPRRNLGWFHTYPQDKTPEDLYRSWVGIREGVLSYYIAELLDPEIAVPRVVRDFMAEFDRKVEEWTARGQIRPVKHIDLARAFEAAQPICISG